MKFPTLKNLHLCIFVMYFAVFAVFLGPIVIAFSLEMVPDIVKVLVFLVCGLGLLLFLLKNAPAFLAVEITLLTAHCYHTARKQFPLPGSFSPEACAGRLETFGEGCQPAPARPLPTLLRYQSGRSPTVYFSGIERIAAAYHTEFLDKSEYLAILSSASINARALRGKKKHRIFDRRQKNAPISQVSVIFIFAEDVEGSFRQKLWDEVTKKSVDGYELSVLPCVMDLKTGVCTFDSLRIPYLGFRYPAKNRGIKLIKKYVFRGKLPLSGGQPILAPGAGFDMDQSLWELWKTARDGQN